MHAQSIIRSIITCLPLTSALLALAPAASQAQENQVVEDILSQILSGDHTGGAPGGCRPIDRRFFNTRLNRLTHHFYRRIHRDSNQGLIDRDATFHFIRRVHFIHNEGEHFIADGCLTSYERNHLRRDVHRLNDELTKLEKSG